MGKPSKPPHSGLTSAQQAELASLVIAAKERRSESLPLFEAMDNQKGFLASCATTRVLRGGNRSGKTTCGAVETARCALDQDPHKKYREGPKTIWVIGYGESHVGRVLFSKLFQAGAFKVIKDKETGLDRAFRPWDKADAARAKEAKNAPPLIPGRFIEKKGIVWKNRGLRLPDVVRLKNGTEIYFFTSGGEPPMGSAVDLIWIDEDIEDPGWVPEMRMRLPDRKGRMIWTAWPWSSNDALVDLSKRAESQASVKNPTVEEWVIAFSENAHIDAGAKAEALADLAFQGEQVLASRDKGQYGFGDAMVFPYFHLDTHGFKVDDLPAKQVPPDWVRFLCVDPGHSEAAALFVAIPPPDLKGFENMVLIYDEVYQTKASASTMADAIEKKARGQSFQAFLIDNHGSRKTEEGSGRTIKWQYQKEFERLNLRSEMTGHDFFPGTDDIPGRISAVREAMRITDKPPKFRVLCGATPRLLWELERYRFVRDAKTNLVTEKPNDKGIHLCVVAQYLFAWPGLRYYKPKVQPARTAMSFFQKIKRKRRLSEENVIPLY